MERLRPQQLEASTRERLGYSLDLTRKAFDTALDLLDGWDNPRYAHLKDVVDPSRVQVLSDEVMDENNPISWGWYDPKKDLIYIRESSLIPEVVLHEHIHRATLSRFRLGYEVSDTNRALYSAIRPVPKDSPSENEINQFNQEYKSYKDNFTSVDEGLVQWSTIYLADRTPNFDPPYSEGYEGKVDAVRLVFTQTFGQRGYARAEIDRIMLDYILTDDATDISSKIIPVQRGGYVRDIVDLYKSIGGIAGEATETRLYYKYIKPDETGRAPHDLQGFVVEDKMAWIRIASRDLELKKRVEEIAKSFSAE